MPRFVTVGSLLAEGRIFAAPGASDAYSARIVEHLGFPAVYLGGNAAGLEFGKGQPFIEARDMIDLVGRVRSAVDVPVIVDAAAGFGDAAHARRAVRDLESAGASALHIDDQVHPKRAHYHLGVGELASVDVVAGKLKEAVAARRSGDCLIVARTDALRVTKSLDDTIARARAYLATGVDGLLVLGAGPEEAPQLKAKLPGAPLFWIATTAGELPTLPELEAAGFSAALYPFHGVAAATEALLDVWGALASDGRPGATRRPAKALIDTALELVDMPRAWEIERRTTVRGGKD